MEDLIARLESASGRFPELRELIVETVAALRKAGPKPSNNEVVRELNRLISELPPRGILDD